MNFTRTRFLKTIQVSIVVIVVVLIILYIGFRSLPYLRGPEILVFEPVSGITISSTTTTIIGQALRVNSLSMNDNPIQVDESGNFKETLIVFPGLNIIKISATDQFQRSVTHEIRLVGSSRI